jgi:transcriptional regulator with XRE-family HTH domain
MKKRDLLICDLNQTEIAAKLGVSQPMVSKWFSGKVIPRIDNIVRICKALDITHEEFIEYLYARNQRLVELCKKQKR